MSVLHNLFKVKKYVTKYASKPETKSSLFVSSAKTIFSGDVANLHTKDLLRKVMTKVLSQRDIAVMEAIHLLMGWNLHKSNITVTNVNLVSSRKLVKNKNSKVEIKDSLVDLYAKREDDLQDMNIDEFAKQFTCLKGLRHTRPKAEIVALRFFQKFSSNPEGENYWQYCKYQLLRYKSWRVGHDNALAIDDNNEQLAEDEDGWIESWRLFLETPSGQSAIPDWHQRYHEVNRRWDVNDGIDLLEMDQGGSDVDSEPDEQEEWQLNMNPVQEKGIGPDDNATYATEETFEKERAKYSAKSLEEMPQWMSNAKKDDGDTEMVYEQVDLNMLNSDQLLAYDIVRRNFAETPEKQLLLRVEGQGGLFNYLTKKTRLLLDI